MLCERGHLLIPENLGISNKKLVCRLCRNENARRSAHRLAEMAGKPKGVPNASKTHCSQGHEYTDENTYRYGPGGRYRQCRICRNEHVKASYRRHHEQRLGWHRAHQEANREVYREYSRRWQQENRERSNLLSRIKKQRRRAAGTLTVEDWELVLDVYGRRCLACGKDEVTIDHVVPVSCGGLNEISNVQPLCGYCNTSKGAKTVDYRPEPWVDVAERAA